MTLSLFFDSSFPIVIASIVIIFLTYFLCFKPKHNLPGPFAWPLFGNIFSLGKHPFDTLAHWSKKYGPVYRIYLGRNLAVVLSDVDIVKEALVVQGNNFNGRPHPLPYTTRLISNGIGLLMCEGEFWQKQRQFAQTTLKDFGMGRNILEEKINEEVTSLVEEIIKTKGAPFSVYELFSLAFYNVICSLISGNRYTYQDSNFIKLLKCVRLMARSSGTTNILNGFPLSRFFVEKAKKMYDDVVQNKIIVNDFHAKIINEHLENFDSNDINNYIDAFIKEMKKDQNNAKTTFTETQLKSSLVTLLMAGTQTVVSTFEWGVLFLANHPDVVKKLQEEIDNVIGSRLPTMSDQDKMPYTRATIMEIQRLANVVPLGVPHSNFKEAIVSGYCIPSRSVILTNLWAIHTDEKLWDEPKKFDPVRFLDKTGKVIKPEYFIPFGVGKRLCLGDTLAKMELFLFLTTLFQRLTFYLPEGKPPPSLEPGPGLTNSTRPYEICARLR